MVYTSTRRDRAKYDVQLSWETRSAGDSDKRLPVESKRRGRQQNARDWSTAEGGFIKDGNGAAHIGPEDTFDADYGRLLARVMESPKGGTSPAGTDASQCLEVRGGSDLEHVA